MTIYVRLDCILSEQVLVRRQVR